MSPDLEALLLACLDKEPTRRSSANEARLRLEGLAEGTGNTPVYAAPVAPPHTTSEAGVSRANPVSGEPAPNAPDAATRHRTLRRRRLPLVVAALVAVLALAAAIATPLFLQGSDTQGTQQASQQGDPKPEGAASGDGGNSKPEKPTGGDGGSSGNGDIAQRPPSQKAPTSTTAQSSAAQSSASPSASAQATAQATASATAQAAGGSIAEASRPDGLTREAAARTVEEFYTSAAAGDYGRSSELLTAAYRQATFPDTATFEGTFATLESVRFIRGPEVEASGDGATVRGVTVARHTDGTERNSGTWTLVEDGSVWKISNIEVASVG